MPVSSTIRLLFPYEMNGSGTPVRGSTPSTAKKLTVAWIRITEVMPAATSFAYRSFAMRADRSPA